MNDELLQKFSFQMENDQGELVVKGEILGESQVPVLDDLKLKAVIALLNSVDQQNFNEAGKSTLFDSYVNEIEETINEMKKHQQFQGKIGSCQS